MRNKKWLVIAAAAVLTAALSGCAMDPGTYIPGQITVYTQDASDQNTVSVSATGTIKVMPDIAYITVGVMTQQAEAAQAQSDNSVAMNALFDALKAAGLTDDDLETTGYSVNPMYNYDANTGVSEIYAYQVINTVRITVRDISRAGEILTVAAENGANTNYSVEFTLEDTDAHYNEALAKAMEEAKSKADTLAEAGGFSLGIVLSVSEGSYSYSPIYDYAESSEASFDRETPVSAGELEISATVTVVYKIC